MAQNDSFYTRHADKIAKAATDYRFAAIEAKSLGDDKAFGDFVLMAAVERRDANHEVALARASGEKV